MKTIILVLKATNKDISKEENTSEQDVVDCIKSNLDDLLEHRRTYKNI